MDKDIYSHFYPQKVCLPEPISCDHAHISREHCNNGSLILLEEDMIDRGLDFVCEENPP